jgi:hypothetical protein
MKLVPASVSRAGGRTLLKLQKNSPTILVVSGVIGLGATAVMAAKASRRAEPVLEQHAKNRIQIEELALTEEQRRSQVISIYKDTTLQLAAVYGPTIVVGTVSAASILYGHRILQRRHFATAMAFTSLQEQFAAYRARVAKSLGAERERDIYNGAHLEHVEDPDHPGEWKLQSTFDADRETTWLTPWFDERSINCRPDPVGNYLFLKLQQASAQRRLELRGYVFLNEVLHDLGLEEIPEGQSAGWLYHGDGDNFVDFGFMGPSNDPEVVAFQEGRTNIVRLNFNIDGDIQAKMLEQGRKTMSLSS